MPRSLERLALDILHGYEVVVIRRPHETLPSVIERPIEARFERDPNANRAYLCLTYRTYDFNGLDRFLMSGSRPNVTHRVRLSPEDYDLMSIPQPKPKHTATRSKIDGDIHAHARGKKHRYFKVIGELKGRVKFALF